jgi:pyruvate/2-oxoglutarate dehydrogenase complex dihydrolipoamide dehydrogenase (E3) component
VTGIGHKSATREQNFGCDIGFRIFQQQNALVFRSVHHADFPFFGELIAYESDRRPHMSNAENGSQSNRKTSPEEYDLVILGSGAGSKIAAWTFGGQGQRVAVIERKYVGGSCPNIACLPSKNIIHAAQVASYIHRSREFGIAGVGFRVDMSAVRDRKRKMVSGLVDTHLDAYKQSGAELIMGTGRFIGPKTIEATLPDGTRRQLRGTNVIIGTGTHAAIEPTPGLAEAQPLTHVEALELDHVPEHLLVIGGGYVGVELAQAMRRFGSKVTIIDRNEGLLHREDEDVMKALQLLFEDEGIEIILNARIKSVSGKSGQSVSVLTEQHGVEKTLQGTHLLVAAGRIPNTEGIGLDLAGVELTDRGYVKVNERLETTAPNVWAVGEVAGSPQFTHISEDDFRVFSDNVTGGNHVTTGRQVPFCLYTDPEFARVGLSEKEAKAQGKAYRLFKVPMAAVLRARALVETRGFLKALVAIDDDRLLGFAGFGVGAGEVMSAVQIAMIAELPYRALRDAVLAHPTLVEGLHPLFSSAPSVQGEPVHEQAAVLERA